MRALPTPPDTASLNPALQQQALLKRLSSLGPGLVEVASDLLSRELETLYPELDIDPDTTSVATPHWAFVDDEMSCRDIQFEPLTLVLLRLCLDNSLANYVEGEHFLAHEPPSPTPKHLEVSIEEIANLLNDLAPALFVEFKERQLAFWNESGDRLVNWQAFSNELRQAFNVAQVGSWDAEHCSIAHAVATYPDKKTRHTQRPELADVQVCLIDIDTSDSKELKHKIILGAAVLTGRFQARDILLMYTIENGYESFDTLHALGEAILTRLSPVLVPNPMLWRLIEPDGDFFDHMAWAMIDSQLQAIESLGGLDEQQTASQFESPPTDAPDSPEQNRIDLLQGAIPEWLRNASTLDLDAYSNHLMALGTVRDQVSRDLFEIPSIQTFAQQKMREAVIADKTAEGADKLPLDTLQITRTESFTVGVFVLPNPLDRHTQTLGEFALSNARPYMASINFNPPHPVPEWLTIGYLTTLAERVDIGKVYPQLIQSKLIDDPVEAPRQRRHYERQLRSLLPLLALECKVRQQGNVDEQGYRYINELVDPTPDSRQPIVVRPLALYPLRRIGGSNDNVLNMFIIGPRNSQDGPCLLYRPLMDEPLLQFRSLQNLLYALHQPGELRESVIAWLPNRALSFNYSQYAFPIGLPSPWLMLQSLSEPLSLLEWSGSVGFSTTELTGNVFAALFEANTKAMVELADRQSLSNADRRWALLEDSGWAVFNAASSFFNGYAGAAVWVWQMFNDIQQTLDAHRQGNRLVEWTRLGDVLMALSILLMQHAHQRRQTSAQPQLASLRPMPRPVIAVRRTLSAHGLLPHSERAVIALDGSVPRRTPEQLNTLLDGLKVEAPDLSHPDVTVATPHHVPALYQLHHKAFAQVDQRWFEVVEDPNENILIVNPQEPSRTGPRLVHDYNNTWRVDTSLRLLGSGRSLKSQLKASRLVKAQHRLELEQQLKAAKEKETTARNELRALYNQFVREAGTASPLPCLQKADELIALYKDSLEHLQAWREAGATTGYPQELFRLMTEYHKHLNIWIALEQRRYATLITDVRQILSDDRNPRQTVLDNIAQMTEMGNKMAARRELLDTSLKALPAVGANGIILAERLKSLSPPFTVWDIKRNEIASIYEPCLREQAALNMDEARVTVGIVVHRAAMVSQDVARMMREPPAYVQPEERAEHLLNIVDEYASVSQRIDELPVDYPELVEPIALQRLKGLVGEFQQWAQTELERLLPRVEGHAGTVAKQPVASSSRSFPKAIISKTRPRDLPVKTSEFPDQHALHIITPRIPRPAISANDYRQAVSAALELNLDANSFIQRTRLDALRPKRTPVDMQDIFDQQALRLEQAADIIDRMDSEAIKKGHMLPVVTLPAELRSGAARMRREGIVARATMLKARKPRQADLQWLIDHDQVRLVCNKPDRIKTQQYQDYFQEYEILDATYQAQPLWLAHFHYPSLKTAPSRFTAAHIKIAEQHLQLLPPEARRALTTRTPWDNHLRKISDPLLQAAFLKLKPLVAVKPDTHAPDSNLPGAGEQ